MTAKAVLILDSSFWGEHISGGGGVNSMHFLMFCILGVFVGGILDSGAGEFPPRR